MVILGIKKYKNSSLLKKAGGYTLVEAVLAITISASLITMLVGLASFAGKQKVQFSLKSLESEVRSQYEDTRYNLNSFIGDDGNSARLLTGSQNANCKDVEVTAPGNTKCYLVGRYIKFDKDTIFIVKLIFRPSFPNAWPDYNKDSIDNLSLNTGKFIDTVSNPNDKNANFKVIHLTLGELDKASSGAYMSNSNKTGISGIAIVRSPLGNAVLSVPVTSDNLAVRDNSLKIEGGDSYINLVFKRDNISASAKNIFIYNTSQGKSALCVDTDISSSLSIRARFPYRNYEDCK